MMELRMCLNQSLRQEQRLVQTLQLVDFLKIPDEVLSMVSVLVAANPGKVECVLESIKSDKGNFSQNPSSKIRSIYSSLVPSKGDSDLRGGIVGSPDFRNLEFLVGQKEVIVTPDVTYVGRKEQKPEIVFSDHLRGSGPQLLQIDPSAFPETAKLFAQFKRFDSWKRGKLVEAYVFLGGKQREYFETFNPRAFHIFNQSDLAKTIELHYSTVYRILDNRWIEARNLQGEQKIMFAKDLLKTKADIAKYDHFEKLNRILMEESKIKRAYSDQELAKKSHPVSRRAITKYREQNSIPDSRDRKREYAQGREEPFLFNMD